MLSSLLRSQHAKQQLLTGVLFPATSVRRAVVTWCASLFLADHGLQIEQDSGARSVRRSALAALLLLIAASATAQDQLQLPAEVSQWFVNTDGSCVQCSNSNCGVWHNLPQESTLLFNTQQYGRAERGGSGPSRVEAYCDRRGIPVYNVTGDSFEDTRPWMIWASQTGRMAAIGCFGSHFQTLLWHSNNPADPKPWKVRNNWYGTTGTFYEWTEAEFRRNHLASGPWVVIPKTPPPPMLPVYVNWWK